MDEETKSLILALFEKMGVKDDNNNGGNTAEVVKSPVMQGNSGLRGMRGLNSSHLNKYLMPDAKYFRRLMGFDV